VPDPINQILSEDEEHFTKLWESDVTAAELWAYSYTEPGKEKPYWNGINRFLSKDKERFNLLYKMSSQHAIDYLDKRFTNIAENDNMSENKNGLYAVAVGSRLHVENNEPGDNLQDLIETLINDIEQLRRLPDEITKRLPCYCFELDRWRPLRKNCHSIHFPVDGDSGGILEAEVWVVTREQLDDNLWIKEEFDGRDIIFWNHSAYTSEDGEWNHHAKNIITALRGKQWLEQKDKLILNIRKTVVPPLNERFRGNSLGLAIAIAAFAAKHGLLARNIVATGALDGDGNITAIGSVDIKVEYFAELCEKLNPYDKQGQTNSQNQPPWRFIYCGDKAKSKSDNLIRIQSGAELGELVRLNHDGTLIPDLLLPKELDFESSENKQADPEYIRQVIDAAHIDPGATLMCVEFMNETQQAQDLLQDTARDVAKGIWHKIKDNNEKNARPVIVDLAWLDEKKKELDFLTFEALRGNKNIQQPEINADIDVLQMAIRSALRCAGRLCYVAFDSRISQHRSCDEKITGQVRDFVKNCEKLGHSCILIASDASVMQSWETHLNSLA